MNTIESEIANLSHGYPPALFPKDSLGVGINTPIPVTSNVQGGRPIRPMRPILPSATVDTNGRINLLEDTQLQRLRSMMNQHSHLLLQTFVMAKAQNLPDHVKLMWEQLQDLAKHRDDTKSIKSRPYMSMNEQIAFTYFDVPILRHLQKIQPLVNENTTTDQLTETLKYFEKITKEKQPIDSLISKFNALIFYKIFLQDILKDILQDIL